jgi:hypothetical protein
MPIQHSGERGPEVVYCELCGKLSEMAPADELQVGGRQVSAALCGARMIAQVLGPNFQAARHIETFRNGEGARLIADEHCGARDDGTKLQQRTGWVKCHGEESPAKGPPLIPQA